MKTSTNGHGCSTEILDTVVKSSSSSSPISQAFCSYLYYFAEEIVEALCSKIAWYFYTDISAGSNGNFRGKTKRIFDCRVCSFWKIVPVSDTKFVQFVQNQNIVKLTWCSRPKIKMLKYCGEVSIIFLQILNVLIIHEFLITEFLVFWTTVPVSRGFDIMPKLRECVQNKSKTLFRIASHFWTNIEYSRRVLTSIFVEMILRELTPEAEYEFCVSKHPDFIICPCSKISSTTKPKLLLKSLDISKQRSTVFRRIGWVFPWKF